MDYNCITNIQYSKPVVKNKPKAVHRTDLPAEDTIEQVKPAIKPATVKHTATAHSKDFALFKNPPPITIRARLLSETSASYYEDDSCYNAAQTEPYLYKVLKAKHSTHLKYLGDTDIAVENYRSPYNRLSFNFQVPATCIATRLDIPCMLESLVGELCTITMRIMPYDFINKTTKKRIVGLVIKVSSIAAVKKE